MIPKKTRVYIKLQFVAYVFIRRINFNNFERCLFNVGYVYVRTTYIHSMLAIIYYYVTLSNDLMMIIYITLPEFANSKIYQCNLVIVNYLYNK